jgi:uncharacterized membrane protein YeiB
MALAMMAFILFTLVTIPPPNLFVWIMLLLILFIWLGWVAEILGKARQYSSAETTYYNHRAMLENQLSEHDGSAKNENN